LGPVASTLTTSPPRAKKSVIRQLKFLDTILQGIFLTIERAAGRIKFFPVFSDVLHWAVLYKLDKEGKIIFKG
jgi:hypothetical protein